MATKKSWEKMCSLSVLWHYLTGGNIKNTNNRDFLVMWPIKLQKTNKTYCIRQVIIQKHFTVVKKYLKNDDIIKILMTSKYSQHHLSQVCKVSWHDHLRFKSYMGEDFLPQPSPQAWGAPKSPSWIKLNQLLIKLLINILNKRCTSNWNAVLQKFSFC